MGSVFISYASQDADAAARICEALQAADVKVWFDRNALRGGDAWDAQIRKRIQDCALFIPVISAHTDARSEGYFRGEWNLATRRMLNMAQDAAFLVPVVIDGTREADARVPEEFLRAQWTWLPGGDTPPAFANRVRELLEGEPAAARHERPAAARPHPVRGTGLALAASLVVLGAGGFWYYQRTGDDLAAAPTTAAAPREKSIAVLPFENRSDEPQDAFFADGMHDDILMQLTKIGAMRVIARTSVEQFRDTKLSTRDIGAKLGVTTVLEGSVQRAGDRVRVTVQLIDARTDSHLWAEAYDRELTAANIFAIQRDVATTIADALKATLTPGERSRVDSIPTKNLDAWEAYQLARQRIAKRTSAGLRGAEMLAQKAIATDPQFALAYSALAEALALQVGYSDAPERATNDRAQAAVQHALEIDPRLSEAWAISGLIAGNRQQNELAEKLYRRAIELNPNNSMALKWLGSLLVDSGRLAEGQESLERAAGVDPLSAITRSNLADALEAQGKFVEAAAQFRRAIGIDPWMPGPHASLGSLNAYAFNRYAEAIPLVQTALELDPGNPRWSIELASLYLDLGDDEKSFALFRQAAKRWPDNAMIQIWLAILDLLRGDYAGLARHSERSLALAPAYNFGAILGLRNADLHDDRCEDALERFREAFPELYVEDQPQVDRTNYFVAIDGSLLLLKCGDAARADALLADAEQVVSRIPRMGSTGHGIGDVRIHALRGDKAKALAALREAKNAGWRSGWRYLIRDPDLAAIRDEPEFRAIYAEIERDMARQRAELKALPPEPLQTGVQ
jgi:TolB-like protein/Tfp pilus assembly protein PilF